MYLTHSAPLVLSITALGCTASDAGPPRPIPTSPASSHSADATGSDGATATVPSYPADATVSDGATATIPLKASKGNLYVAVESQRTPAGTKTTLRVTRQEDCHVDDADGEAQMFVCTTVYDRTKTLPPGAFTFDSVLGTSRLTTTVEKTPMTVTWVGYGDVRRKVNKNGNLLVEARDAKASTTWGRVRHTDRDGTDTPSSVYHRITAKAIGAARRGGSYGNRPAWR